MKANELRLNNWLKCEEIGNTYTDRENYQGDCVFQVTQINSWGVRLDIGHGAVQKVNFDENLSPIELTEEWLLKFGFEDWGIVEVNEYEKYKRFVLYNAVDGTNNYEVHIITSTYGDTNCIEICYYINNDERQTIYETEFVHNLQNAFHLAIGQELCIEKK